MRDTMSPHQADMWRAFRVIQPDYRERVCEILKRGFTAVANAFGGKYEPADFDPVPEESKPEQTASPEQAAAIAAMSLGPADGHGNR